MIAKELVRLRRGRGTSEVRYRCSVPGLAGFAASRLHGFRSLIRLPSFRLAISDYKFRARENRKSPIANRQLPGGEGGIRTHGTVSRTQHFQCCQFSHSCTSPESVCRRQKAEGSQNRTTLLLLTAYCFLPTAYCFPGGEGGIRTHGTLTGTTVFETARFNHSRTSPHVVEHCVCREKTIVASAYIQPQGYRLRRLADD
jgi:hypothetical protein